MKMKKLVVSVFTIVLLSIGLWSCLNGGNSSSYNGIPAIVTQENGVRMLQLPVMSFNGLSPCLAPTLPSSYNVGDYLIVGFTIDFDNQPDAKHTTLSDLVVYESDMPSSSAIIAQGDEAKGIMEDMTTDSIVNINSMLPFSYTAFTGFQHKASKDVFMYDMLFNEDSFKLDNVGNKIYSVYFFPRKTSIQLNSSSEYRNYVFEIYNILNSPYAKDTVLSDDISAKLCKVNMFYKSGTKDGKNVFKAIGSNPVELSTLLSR